MLPLMLIAAALQVADASVIAPARPTFTVKPSPNGATTPSLQDLYRQLYPPRALAAGVSGDATVRCTTSAVAGFSDCVLLSERPTGYGFGNASLQLLAEVLPPALKIKEGEVRALPVRWRTGGAPTPVGIAKMTCVATVQGTLRDCHIISEDPSGHGVGQAELNAAKLFRVKAAIRDGMPVEAPITIPMRFQVGDDPATPAPATLTPSSP